MNRTTSFYCPECDHEHVVEIIQDEFSDYAELPERCEACGEDFDAIGEPDDRRRERQQMGITY